MMQTGSVAYVDACSPKNLGTTAQAIRGGVMLGLGIGLGSIINGFIYEKFGSVALFRSTSLLALVGLLSGLVAFMLIRQRARR